MEHNILTLVMSSILTKFVQNLYKMTAFCLKTSYFAEILYDVRNVVFI